MHQIAPDTEVAIKRFLSLVETRYDLECAILYGSRARGTHDKNSDTDLAIILQGKLQAFLKTLLAMSDVAFEVLIETGINITPLPLWLDEWEHPEKYTNPALLRNIARDGIRV